MEKLKDRFIGALYGLIVGNALGAPYMNIEFDEIKDFSSGGIFNLKLGEWTDVSSMALCLAESLIEDGFDLNSQMKKYIKWVEEGYMSSKEKSFGIDNQTLESIIYYEKNNKFVNITKNDSCKPLARLASVPMYFKSSFKDAVYYSGQSAYTTHNNMYTIHACKYLGGLIQQSINGTNKKILLSEVHKHMDLIYDVKLRIVDIPYKTKNELNVSDSVLDILEIVLWSFYNTDNFKDAVLTAVNFGGSTDVIGAIIGQIAGAYYGFDSIPKLWTLKIVKRDKIMQIIEKLYEVSK